MDIEYKIMDFSELPREQLIFAIFVLKKKLKSKMPKKFIKLKKMMKTTFI